MRVALIDLGTTALRFEVYEVDLTAQRSVSGRPYFDLIHQEREMPRLGKGLFARGMLNPDGAEQTRSFFRRLPHLLQEFSADQLFAGATSAFREASDGREFVEELEQISGVPIPVLSGVEEAVLTARGILAHDPNAQGKCTLVDIGGGSTEISSCEGGVSVSSVSLPLGAIRDNFIFLRCSPTENAPPSPAGISELRRNAQEVLRGSTPELTTELLIGSSGTVRALCKLHFSNKVPDGQLTRSEIAELTDKLCQGGFEERCKIAGLERNRADIIVAGAILLDEIFQHSGAKLLQQTKYSLRHGLLDAAISSICQIAPG